MLQLYLSISSKQIIVTMVIQPFFLSGLLWDNNSILCASWKDVLQLLNPVALWSFGCSECNWIKELRHINLASGVQRMTSSQIDQSLLFTKEIAELRERCCK